MSEFFCAHCGNEINSCVCKYSQPPKKECREIAKLRAELAEAREALHRKCQCDFRDGIQVSECHLHAVQRSGRRENGDPKEWRSKPEQFIAGEVVPVDRLRALCAHEAEMLRGVPYIQESVNRFAAAGRGEG